MERLATERKKTLGERTAVAYGPADEVDGDDTGLFGLSGYIAGYQGEAEGGTCPERETDVVGDQKADAVALAGVFDGHEHDGANDAPVVDCQRVNFWMERMEWSDGRTEKNITMVFCPVLLTA
jgi:hypothetical protein